MHYRRIGTIAAGACAVAWTAGTGLAQADDQLIRRDGTWHVQTSAGTYRVQPRVITVKFAEGTHSLSELTAEAQRRALPPATKLDGVQTLRSNRLGYHDLLLPAGADVIAVREALRATGLTASAELNTLGTYTSEPNDPLFDQQWALNNTGQDGGTPGADINVVDAWDIERGDSSVIIAVIDSGTEYYHDDLQPNMWTNEDEIENNGVDDDSNGFIDDYRGWDFANGDNDPVGPYEHGTLVAGIVSGRRNNFEGIAGIAGGDFFSQGCQIMGLGVGDFFPDGSAIDDAIIYATDMGAQVITLSLSVSSSSAIDAAIEYAVAEGVFIDCAAGNNGPSVGYPASHPDVMAVAATDHDDEVAGFSNPGPEVEVAAPGVDILSTSENGGYDESSGTSFAAPQVAGVAGLMFSLGPCVTAEDVRQTLIDTAVDIEAPGFDLDTGHGRIDAFAALQALIDVGIPNGCLCPADFDGSGDVDVNDLLTMLADWGACADCAADLDDSGMVDVDDLLDLLAAWGPCA